MASQLPPEPPGAPRPMPPAPSGTSTLPPRRRRRQDSGLYLPVWSVALMLLIVFLAAFALFGLVLSLGGNSAPSSQPRIVIITAIPSETPVPGAQPTTGAFSAPPTALVAPGALPTFALEGPTLPPVILSPTPIPILVGTTVVVDVASLNVRAAPGTDQELLFMAPEGTLFTVTEGPQSATGYTWWRIQNPADPQQTGWAAAQFLLAQAAPPTPSA